MPTSRFKEFVQLLLEFPPAAWNATLTEEPEWKWMKPFANAWEFGHFAALFIMLGLNDYQTKGKADVGYWPKVVPLIDGKRDPREPRELIDLLEPFYSGERLHSRKVKRLRRFMESELCREIWVSDCASIAADLDRIWRALGRTMKPPSQTMKQQLTKKTIAFAMKCLALALHMLKETRFDFGMIPVPVDSRIRTVSARLGLHDGSESTERQRWAAALRRIRETHPEITMVHLDSLLWQIAPMLHKEMRSHLITLGAGDLASRIPALFDTDIHVVDSPTHCRS